MKVNNNLLFLLGHILDAKPQEKVMSHLQEKNWKSTFMGHFALPFPNLGQTSIIPKNWPFSLFKLYNYMQNLREKEVNS